MKWWNEDRVDVDVLKQFAIYFYGVPIEMAMMFPLWFFHCFEKTKFQTVDGWNEFTNWIFIFIELFVSFYFLAYCICGAFAQTVVKMTEIHIKNVRSVSFYTTQTNINENCCISTIRSCCEWQLMIGCIQRNRFTFACRQSFMIYLLKSNPDKSTKYYICKYM